MLSGKSGFSYNVIQGAFYMLSKMVHMLKKLNIGKAFWD